MIRPILTELLLFIMPFALYVAFLWAIKADVLHPDSWPASRIAGLTIVALVLMAASFFYFAEYTGAPPGSTYIPAHMEDGKFVPGTTR
ncbi:MAG TPA: DUF6111 family protein [Pseudolabrys sp.]|jgi:hypothetical protein